MREACGARTTSRHLPGRRLRLAATDGKLSIIQNLGKAADWFQKSGWQQKATNKVAQGMRAIGKFFKGR